MTDEPDFGGVDPTALLGWVRSRRNEYVELVSELARLETPTDVPLSQAPAQALITRALEDLDYRVRHIPGVDTGGALFARPGKRQHGAALQLLVGHCDTVWPLGTLKTMPVREEDGRLYGPGTFDMKAGLTNILFALRALRELGATPPLTPVVLVNSDEEIGSPESGRTVLRLARRVRRAFVPEPSAGVSGCLKTARKGVGNFEIDITGRAAHAGLDPAGGASAVTELAHVVRRLHGMTDLELGTTVNVGVVRGGTRPNVIAAHAHARVDVRVVSMEEGRRVEADILGLTALTPGVSLDVSGGMSIPPLERTPRNRRLWEAARRAGAALGLDLEDAMVGGASDGSRISGYAATLDGMGAVGDGAHAEHEHILVDATLDRCALLALMLMMPDNATPEGGA